VPNVGWCSGVGFISVRKSPRLLVCQQIVLRFAAALKRGALSSILGNLGHAQIYLPKILKMEINIRYYY